MEFLVWAFMFLLLAVVGSLVGLVGIIGLPIDFDLKAGVTAMAALVAVSGIALIFLVPARSNSLEE